MSQHANARAFAQPHWRVVASGYDVQRWYGDGQAQGTGGIALPQPTRLGSGQYHYRFANSQGTRSEQLGGGWWLDYENFAALRRFAEDKGYSLREAARLTLALPHAWTRVDRLVRALLTQPLYAYTGLGKPAQGARRGPDQGTRWIPTQQVALRQLYIPGLAEGDPPLYEQVFTGVQISRLD